MDELLSMIAANKLVSHQAAGFYLRVYFSESGLMWTDGAVPDDIHALIDYGILEVSDGKFVLPGTKEDDHALMLQWKAFYVAYDGRKRGPNVEIKVLKAKYSNGRWRKIIPILEKEVWRQKDERQAYQAAMDYQNAIGNRKHDMFLPGWKNMQTYLRNAGWEESYLVPEKYAGDRRVSAAPRLEGTAYDRYYNWADSIAAEYNLGEAWKTMILKEDEFNDIVNATHPYFAGYKMYMTPRMFGDIIRLAQTEYFRSVPLRLTNPKFVDYLKFEYTRHKTQ